MASGNSDDLQKLGLTSLTLAGEEGALQYELAKFFLENPSKQREVSARIDNVHTQIETTSSFSAYGTYADASCPQRVVAVRALEKANLLERTEENAYEMADPQRAAEFIQLYEEHH